MAERDWYRKMESRSWSTLWQRGGVVEVGLASPKGNYVRTLGKTTRRIRRIISLLQRPLTELSTKHNEIKVLTICAAWRP